MKRHLNSRNTVHCHWKSHLLIGTVVLAFLAGCSTVKRDWEAANSRGTVTAYQSFLSQHPKSEYSAQAAQRVRQLNEQAARLDESRRAERARIEDDLRKKREKQEQEERERKERLRVIRVYDGATLPRTAIAVIQSYARDLRSARFSKPGIAGICRVDEKEISSETEEIECLPGKHTVTILIQFRPDNVPAGTFAINSTRVDKTRELEAGSTYRIVFDQEKHEADIAKVGSK